MKLKATIYEAVEALLYYFAPRRPSRPLAEWIDDSTWVCRRHIPSVSLPAAADKCWYNRCPSTRPTKVEAVPTPAPREETPPHAAKRRGATKAVDCAHCGDLLWRRPREVRESTSGEFFCNATCRKAGAR